MKANHALLALLMCSGCNTIPDVDDLVIAEPVNCETAQRDLIALDQMRPTPGRSAAVLLSTLTPTGLVVGIVNDDLDNRGRVFNGSFTREIEAKKKAIRDTCGLANPTDPIAPNSARGG